MFLEAFFKPGMELAHLGAIEDQAKRCYRYFRKIVEHPLFVGTLARQASGSRAEFANGSIVEILVGTMAGVNCLHGDTLVDCSRNHTLYPNGVPIRELVGKEFVVPTVNEETGEVVYKKAKGLYSGKAPCVEVKLARPKAGTRCKEMEYTTLICTPQHPILMAESHKYKYAGLLQAGDRVQPAVTTSYLHKADPKYGTRHRDEYRVNIKPAWGEKGKLNSEHRLIAEAWFGGIPEGYDVHHKDNDRLNNDVSNLEILPKGTHQRTHFGDDCQGYITAESLKKMSKSRSIAKDVSLLWQDKEWLKNELQTKPVTQIAYEQAVHYQTIFKWVRKFNLDFTASNAIYTRSRLNQLLNDLRTQAQLSTENQLSFTDCQQTPTKKPAVIINRSRNNMAPECIKQKDWLENELKTKPLTQIAYEHDIPTITVGAYAKKFGLNYTYSTPDYTEQKVRQHMKEVTAQFNKRIEEQRNNLSEDQRILDDQRLESNERKKQLRDGKVIVKTGAWTVISVKPYQDGAEQDVYDISVDTDGELCRNFSTQFVQVSNSPHPVAASLDEVELMDWEILQEAFNMARDAKGYKSATRLTSTRKKNSGTMQKIIEEADQRGLKIYQWNLWDTVETCPLKTDESGHIIDTQEVYFDTDDVGRQISTMVYTSCLTCPMLPACKGQAKTSNAGSKAVISLDDAKKLYSTLDSSVWDAQVICIKPGSESMVYPMFKPEIHVIDYQAALKEKYGPQYDHIFDVDYEVYAGQDAGFICPATVFLQVIDDPETGDQLVIVFDELYEHNIAPSKYIREFLWPRHREYNVQEWFCDPSNSAQLMSEMEEQDLYPVEGLKSVDEGVDACRALFSLGHLLIDKHCKNLIWELGRYEKNPNTGKPIKEDDHLVDAMRYGVNGVGIYSGQVSKIYT